MVQVWAPKTRILFVAYVSVHTECNTKQVTVSLSNNRSYAKRFQNFSFQLLSVEPRFSEIPNKQKLLKLKGLATT